MVKQQKAIAIQVEVLPAINFNDAASEMQALADRTNVSVTANFNGVCVYAQPGGDIKRLIEGYSLALGSALRHQVISSL